MYELAQTNLFTPERKKGGPPTGDSSPTASSHWRFVATCWQALGLGGMEYAAGAWTWTSTRLALMDKGGFNPDAADRGAYSGWCTASPPGPSQSPSPLQHPQLRPPAAAPPQTPGTPSPRPWGPSPPPWTAKA